ncbi:MAG: hypothetical protein IKS39_07140 [Clostridia bacterium]|nr:hypothetical protein [Clostridia bacterium]
MRKLKSVLAVIMALTMLVTLAGTAVAGKNSAQAETASAFPAKYDARKDNIVTPVKDQGVRGNCWAYATMSCLETDAIKNFGYDVNKTDFSENHLSYWVNGSVNDEIGDYYIRSKFMVYSGTSYGLKDDNISEYHIVLNDNEELVYSVMFSTKETAAEATLTEASPADPATGSESAGSKLYRVVSLFEGKSDNASPEDYEAISEYEITEEEIDSNPLVDFVCMGNNDSGAPFNSLYVLILDYNGIIIDCVPLRSGIPANYIYAEENKVYLYDNVSDKRFILGEIYKDGLRTKFSKYRSSDEDIIIPKKYYDNDGFIPNSCVNGDVILFFMGDGYANVAVCENVFMDGFGLDGGGGGNWDMATATLSTFTGIAFEKDNYIEKRIDTDSGLILNKAEYLGGVLNTIRKIALTVIPKYRDKFGVVNRDDFDFDFDINTFETACYIVKSILTDNYPFKISHDWEIKMIDEVNDYFNNESLNVRNKAKRWVTDHGGLRMAFISDDEYLNNNSFYCKDFKNTNHEVEIVGWDDNYSKNNFKVKPKNDGAWLIKNSWGTEGEGTGDKGYFWVSYYDGSLEFIGYSATKNRYFDEYSYTGVIGKGSMVIDEQAYRGSISNNGISIANVYKFNKEEKISSVSVINYGGENILARIRICKHEPNKKSNSITNGAALIDEFHVIENPGYHIFKLNDGLKVKKDEQYVVAVTYYGATKENPLVIPTEEQYNGSLHNGGYFAVFNHGKGQSYYKYTDDITGSQWIDSSDNYGNFYINVLTVPADFVFSDVKVSIKDYSIIKSVKYGDSITFVAESENAPKDAEIHWFIDDENDVVFGSKDVGTGEKYTVNNAEDSILIQAKIINSKGTVLAESTVEELDISLNFIAKIKLFFKNLLSEIKNFIDKILEKIPIKLDLKINIKAD